MRFGYLYRFKVLKTIILNYKFLRSFIQKTVAIDKLKPFIFLHLGDSWIWLFLEHLHDNKLQF